jgi:hypothetical protein
MQPDEGPGGFPYQLQLAGALMVDPSQIREHLEVVGSDGEHVGRVDHVVGDQIELAKLDLAGGFKHHMIPVSWVDHVDEHVHLNVTKDDAKARWTEKPH